MRSTYTDDRRVFVWALGHTGLGKREQEPTVSHSELCSSTHRSVGERKT